MLNFQYKGISQGKYVEGEIEAINNSEAAFKLKEQKVIMLQFETHYFGGTEQGRRGQNCNMLTFLE